MSRTNQYAWQKQRPGHFLLTVQLDPPSESGNCEKHPKLAHFVRRLLDATDELEFPATWAVSDPAYSAATPLILRSATSHELAILGDANWVGPTAGRTRFARELARRVSQARGAGIKLTSLVPRVDSVHRHIDLVIKQRISALAGLQPPPSNRGQAIPKALHYGVWEIPVSAALPLRMRWRFVAKWSLLRRVRTAVLAGANFHLTIDAPAMDHEGHQSVAVLEWLMRRVAEWRSRGMVCVETLAQAAARLSAVPRSSPQHSILRKAA